MSRMQMEIMNGICTTIPEKRKRSRVSERYWTRFMHWTLISQSMPKQFRSSVSSLLSCSASLYCLRSSSQLWSSSCGMLLMRTMTMTMTMMRKTKKRTEEERRQGGDARSGKRRRRQEEERRNRAERPGRGGRKKAEEVPIPEEARARAGRRTADVRPMAEGPRSGVGRCLTEKSDMKKMRLR